MAKVFAIINGLATSMMESGSSLLFCTATWSIRTGKECIGLRCACHSWHQNMPKKSKKKHKPLLQLANERCFLWVTWDTNCQFVDSEVLGSWSRSVDDLGQIHSIESLYQHLGGKSGLIGKSLDLNHINCRLTFGFWFAICCWTGFGGNHLHHPGAVLKNDFLRRVGIADIDNPKQLFDSQMHVSSWYVTCGKSFLQTSMFVGKLTTNPTQSSINFVDATSKSTSTSGRLALQVDFQGQTGRVRLFNSVEPKTNPPSHGDRDGVVLLRQADGCWPVL